MKSLLNFFENFIYFFIFLQTDSKTFLQTYQIIQEGAIRLGAIGSNINVANVMASVFIATGQDPGNVVESATAQLHASAITKEHLSEVQEKVLYQNNTKIVAADEGGVYVSMQLPSVIAATVGGGTMLATQKECLQIMGCYGKVIIGNHTIIKCFSLLFCIGNSPKAC